MAGIIERPLFTQHYDNLADLALAPGSAYVFAASSEERSTLPSTWVEKHKESIRFIQITEQSAEEASFKATVGNGAPQTISLRSKRQLEEFVKNILAVSVVYLDITGQDQATWAAILRALLLRRTDTRAVYVEPREYAYSATPTEGEIFDLSERIRGLQSLPGFASLRSSDEDYVLIPLLGFEGARFAYLIEQLQPESANIVPIIGLPGFRSEYPFHAYAANKSVLLSTRAWKDVRYARANCPFSLFYALTDIAERYPGLPVRLAPIGTKPHALGAVLFTLANQSSGQAVELVYDHPIRKATRTLGAQQASVYFVSSFLPGI